MSMASAAMNLTRRGICASTAVTFPSGAVRGTSKVVDLARISEEKIAILLEQTPFHPVDKSWPDQPADKGRFILTSSGKSLEVLDCQIFAVHKETQEVRESCDVPKADRKNWHFTVAHVIDSNEVEVDSLIDTEVSTEVDQLLRERLSLHHSACHLAAFAFNYATREFWSKTLSRVDSLGTPNLDQLAMNTSFIYPDRSEDSYRFGQSIKKAGLQVDRLFSALPAVQDRVNDLLAEWIKTGKKITVETVGPGLDDTRTWQCELPLGMARLPCGGTHVTALSAFGGIQYQIGIDDTSLKEKRLLAITTVHSVAGE